MPTSPRRSPLRPLHALLALVGGLWLFCSLTTGCAGFRSVIRDLKNDDLLGESSPGILDGTWVPADADGIENGDVRLEDDRNTADERWRLLVFFLPT